MKVHGGGTAGFSPVTITVAFETQAEWDAMRAIFSNSWVTSAIQNIYDVNLGYDSDWHSHLRLAKDGFFSEAFRDAIADHGSRYHGVKNRTGIS